MLESEIDLENFSKIPNWKLKKIIKFCIPAAHKKLCKIVIKNGNQPLDGNFYYGGKKPPKILIKIGSKKHFPLSFKIRTDKIKRTGYFGSYNDKTQIHCLVRTLSHEIHHDYLWADKKRSFWFLMPTGSKKNKDVEKLADRFSFKRVRQYEKMLEQGIDPFEK